MNTAYYCPCQLWDRMASSYTGRHHPQCTYNLPVDDDDTDDVADLITDAGYPAFPE